MSRRFLAAVLLAIALPAWSQQPPKLEPLPELPPPPPRFFGPAGRAACAIHPAAATRSRRQLIDGRRVVRVTTSFGPGVLPDRGPGDGAGLRNESLDHGVRVRFGDPPVLTLAPASATARALCLFHARHREELSAWLKRYAIGALVDLQASLQGSKHELLRHHFARPLRAHAFREAQRSGASLLSEPHGAPCASRHTVPRGRSPTAATVPRNLERQARLFRHLPSGAPVSSPQPRHCEQVGGHPCRHASCRKRLRRKARESTGAEVVARGGARGGAVPRRRVPRAACIELEFQALHRTLDLPRVLFTPICFRDNVLFDGDRIGGVIDFYFAGIDALLFDVAVTVNDWCVDPAGEIDSGRATALVGAYRRAREFTRVEQQAWPVLLRAAALRFWLFAFVRFSTRGKDGCGAPRAPSKIVPVMRMVSSPARGK